MGYTSKEYDEWVADEIRYRVILLLEGEHRNTIITIAPESDDSDDSESVRWV
jgi:hypothetical protein